MVGEIQSENQKINLNMKMQRKQRNHKSKWDTKNNGSPMNNITNHRVFLTNKNNIMNCCINLDIPMYAFSC